MKSDRMLMKLTSGSVNRKERRATSRRAGQRGLTLIETAAALGIVALMLASFGRLTAENQLATKSRATAIQANQVTNAASQYIQANFSKILAATADGATTVYVPTGRVNIGDPQPTGSPIPSGGNLDSLQTQGFLAQTYTDKNPYGQRTVLAITQPKDPATLLPTGRLEGMVLTYGGQTIPDSELGRIATSIGASGGFVAAKPPAGVPANVISGAYGGWRIASSDWNVPAIGVSPQAGHIASTLAFQGGVGENDYLNRNFTGDPKDNTMNTAILMNGNDLLNARNVTATGAVSGGTLAAGTTVNAGTSVNSPLVQGTLPTGMVFNMNANSAVNVGTIAGISQDLGGYTDTAVRITTGAQIDGSLAVRNDVAIDGDLRSRTVSTDRIAAKQFIDSGNPTFTIRPSGYTNLQVLNPSTINADTVMYGSSVNRDVMALNPNTLSCLPTDKPCNDNKDIVEANYLAAVAAANAGAKSMRLGDLLPNMVPKGVFVVGSDGSVTDGQSPPSAIAWSTTNGAVALPANSGAVLQPTCPSGGLPQVFISRLDDSTYFDLGVTQPGSSGPPVAVTKAPGGGGGANGAPYDPGGIQSAGWVAVGGSYLPVTTTTVDPAVRDVQLGRVNIGSSPVTIATVPGAQAAGDPNLGYWLVNVSSDSEYTAVPRRVLAQTYCNFNPQRGGYSSN